MIVPNGQPFSFTNETNPLTMADVDLATKAPENDVAVQSVVPGEASVQSGSGLGEHCVSDRPTRKLLSPGFVAALMMCQLLDLHPVAKLLR